MKFCSYLEWVLTCKKILSILQSLRRRLGLVQDQECNISAKFEIPASWIGIQGIQKTKASAKSAFLGKTRLLSNNSGGVLTLNKMQNEKQGFPNLLIGPSIIKIWQSGGCRASTKNEFIIQPGLRRSCLIKVPRSRSQTEVPIRAPARVLQHLPPRPTAQHRLTSERVLQSAADWA